MKDSYIIGDSTIAGSTVIRISTDISLADYLGAVMVRWGINRNNYRVNPGLYSAGSPGAESDVFVTANYKLSFDTLRKNLAGINCWVLVLDTKGINVWCAAGKGTFGTEELVRRIHNVALDKFVNHKRIILPQLGAAGIAAISSFLAMNFTGSSTFTSLSGVKKEMKISLPVQIVFAVTGIILLVIGKLN